VWSCGPRTEQLYLSGQSGSVPASLRKVAKPARELHAPVPRINEIVLEKRAISADTAARLARFFGTTESFWLGMQADYDAHQTKKRLRKELAKISRFRSPDASAA
jgi:addiction module HigA family antidote